jgi:Rod binding domain-containing protein
MIDPTALDTSSPQYQRARAQAQELEGVFLNTLVKQMFSAIKTDGDFGGGFGEETWRSFQAEQLSQSMAEAGGIGLADAILPDLITLQSQPASLPSASGAIAAYLGVPR